MAASTKNVTNDRKSENTQMIKLHILTDESWSISELIEVLDLTKTSINYVNRQFGINSNQKLGNEFAPQVIGVEKGSIELFIAALFNNPVGSGLIANLIFAGFQMAIRKLRDRKKKKEYEADPYDIKVNVVGDNNIIIGASHLGNVYGNNNYIVITASKPSSNDLSK